jgi:cytochrome c biogenesis protein CcmG/thiol:disulfide interchange protein DsbE
MPSKTKLFNRLIPLFILGLALILGSTSSFASFFNPSSSSSDPLPSFSVPTLFNTSKQMTNKSFEGRVSILNVWASWCRYCHNEHGMLMKIKNEYHVPVYGLVYRDNPESARTYLARYGNPYTLIGVDWSGDVGSDLGANGTPQTYIIDKHGVIRYRYTGSIDQSSWNDDFMPLIRKLQAES